MARTRRQRGAAVATAVGALCFAVAFAQRPGDEFTDSRIELTVAPGRFLSDIASVWSSTGDLGHVQGGLFAGYLFPMGPWYALADWVGLPAWVAQRILLGLVLAIAALGVLRLLAAVHEGSRGAHAVGAVVYVLSPYVITSLAVRGTIPLLAYAALPWLLLCVHRALGEPRGWLYPAGAAGAIAVSGGAINAAHVLWMVLAAVALAVYDAGVLRRTDGRGLWSVAWRSAVCVLVATLWWLVPLALQGAYGADFQQFAEHPGAIWQTTSLSESMRLLGFWVLYLGSGFSGTPQAELDVGAQLLFSRPVVAATLLLPLIAVAGLRSARDWRHAPLFGLLAGAGLLVMAVGFPPGTSLRRALLHLSDEVRWLELVRTTYKAAPVVALAYACLAAALAHRLGLRRRWAPAAVALVALAAAAPLVQGRAVDRDTAYGEVPSWWRAALGGDDARVRAGDRVMILPGALFAGYRWGFTTTSVAPALTERPVTIRETIRYADARSAQLLDAVDDLVQQERLVPGQLPSLLRLMGVGTVLVPADGDPVRTGELPPAEAARALARERSFAGPGRAYGPVRRYAPLAGRSGSTRALPAIRVYPGPVGAAAAVRLLPERGAVVLEGDAEGVAELAAHGALDASRALRYAGDLRREQLAAAVARGAELVITDTSRHRIVSAARLRNNHGPTMAATEELPGDAARFDPFGDPRHRTVAVYPGVRLTGGMQPSLPQFPEHRPYAAFDGRVETSWIPRGADEAAKALHIAFERPRRVDVLRLRPHSDASGRTVSVGVGVNGAAVRRVAVRPGWNTVPVRARVARLEFRVLETTSSDPGEEMPGGLAEVDLPGAPIRELLRLPTGLAADARGLPLGRTPVTVLLRRTTADLPYRAGAGVPAAQRMGPTGMVDAEPGLERELTLPRAGTFALDGWASAAPAGNDAALDALAGVDPEWHLESSSRFEGLPVRRASSALDGDPSTAWVGDWPNPRAWLEVRAPRPVTFAALGLRPGPGAYLRPASVRVRAGGRVAGPLPVAADGSVRLPHRVRTRRLRVEIVSVRRGPGPRRLDGVAVAELEAPGLGPVRVPRAGSFASRCGAVTVHASRPGSGPAARTGSDGSRPGSGPAARGGALVEGSLAHLDAGAPLRMRRCGRGLPLPSGVSWLSAPPSVFRADHLRLTSAAARTRPPAVGAVQDPGEGRNGRRDGARLLVRRPGWLVLGESYSRGWRARCGDRDLGEPVPVAGFANGWRVTPPCREASFEFAPQSAATAGYAASLLGALALAGLAAASWRRRRAAPTLPKGSVPIGRVGAVAPGSWRRALAVGAAVALAGGFVFALRAGPPLGLAALLIARYGIDSRRLLAAAGAGGALLVPVYLVFLPEDEGGYNFGYGTELVGAHWIASASLCAVGLACVLEVRRWRR